MPDATAAAALEGRGLVVVTGGGGLLGAAVVRRLTAAGARLRVHLGPPGTSGDIPDGVEVRHAPIDDPAAVAEVLDGAALVVHLAGPASVAASFTDPVGYVRAHVVGAAAVLQALAVVRPERLVHVSSAEVYGRPTVLPVPEEHPTRPLSPYGAAKLGAEALVRTLAGPVGAELVVLRPFSVYGAGSPASSLVGRLLRQAATSDALEVADLRPVRDYVHVDDVAAAVLASCTAALPQGTATFNIASGVGRSVAEVAERVAEAAGRPLPVRSAARLTDRPQDASPGDLYGDASRAEQDLGWRAQVDLTDGLRSALRALRDGGHG